MGNCTSGLTLKKKDKQSSGDNKPNEEVTYASIDHTTLQESRRTRVTTVEDCDYATVNVPAALRPASACSSKDECDDDYVIMG